MVKSAKLQLTGCQIFKSGKGHKLGMVDFELGYTIFDFYWWVHKFGGI